MKKKINKAKKKIMKIKKDDKINNEYKEAGILGEIYQRYGA